jgi:endonuclease-3
MVAPNKQRTLAKLLSLLSKAYSPELPPDLTVLDHLLLGTIQEGAGVAQSLESYNALRQSFHDFNEMRVSHVNEVMEPLNGVLDKPLKAKRILQILQFVFETTYSYDLEQMKRKPLRQAQKQLSMIHGTTPFIVATVVQRSLGGHAIPIDEKTAELLRELDLAGPEETVDQMQSALEHLIPKNQGLEFSLLLSEIVAEPPKKQKLLLKDLLVNKPKSARSMPAKSEPRAAAPASKRGTKKK